MDEFYKQTVESLLDIKDIGLAIANSVVEYFKDDSNIKMINRLKEYGLRMTYQSSKISENTFFTDKTVVLTGTLNDFTRKEAKNIIENMGKCFIFSIKKYRLYFIRR